jgi:hypothetical protein
MMSGLPTDTPALFGLDFNSVEYQLEKKAVLFSNALNKSSPSCCFHKLAASFFSQDVEMNYPRSCNGQTYIIGEFCFLSFIDRSIPQYTATNVSRGKSKFVSKGCQNVGCDFSSASLEGCPSPS